MSLTFPHKRGRSSNFDKCRPELAGEVISDATLAYVGVDDRAKFGDSMLNSGRINGIIRLFGRPDPFYAPLCSIYLHFAVDRKS